MDSRTCQAWLFWRQLRRYIQCLDQSSASCFLWDTGAEYSVTLGPELGTFACPVALHLCEGHALLCSLYKVSCGRQVALDEKEMLVPRFPSSLPQTDERIQGKLFLSSLMAPLTSSGPGIL